MPIQNVVSLIAMGVGEVFCVGGYVVITMLSMTNENNWDPHNLKKWQSNALAYSASGAILFGVGLAAHIIAS